MLQAESPRHTAPKELAQTNQVRDTAPRTRSDIPPRMARWSAQELPTRGSVAPAETWNPSHIAVWQRENALGRSFRTDYHS